jgi:outer membrane protein assembly factor BamE
MQKILIIVLCTASLLVSACSIHKVDVQQGNVITQEMREQIKEGASKRQVSFILGTPLLADPFHRDRWDYVYSLQTGKNKPEIQRMTLFFEDDKLIRIEGWPSAKPTPGTQGATP